MPIDHTSIPNVFRDFRRELRLGVVVLAIAHAATILHELPTSLGSLVTAICV
jgi:hypothetical protein